MKTEVLAVDPRQPEPTIIAAAAAILRGGGLVAFPTETVYGLGAVATEAAAVAGIFRAKGRPASNPLILHVPDVASARALTASWPALADDLAAAFWPGSLTLVVPRGAGIPDNVCASGPTLALRVPAHPVALALLRALQLPVAAPSANRSNYLSPTRADHVLHDLAGAVALILDAGPVPGGLESTVLDVTCTPPRLLRPGLVTPQQLEQRIGPIQQRASVPESGPARSPGLLARHYSPRTPLLCVPAADRSLLDAALGAGQRVGWLTWAEDVPTGAASLVRVAMPREPGAYAAVYYDVLHELDRLELDAIVVDWPPATDSWLAIRDRLERARDPDWR